ncbi:MAG: hypothetical protein GF307_15170 [candidate division Zixibacteria bacterium]|nr:hypothetical protein [candidate division Zixibacteria bacterium]
MYYNDLSSHERKYRVEECFSLDMVEIKRLGDLNRPSGSRIWQWTDNRGNPSGSITFNVLWNADAPVAINLSYMAGYEGRDKVHYDYEIQLTRTQCYLGGYRYWFVCPLTVDGKYCGRRSRILYLPPGLPANMKYFGCRNCHRLTYRTRQWHRDRFYEGLHRPRQIREELLSRLLKVRSSVKRLQLLDRLNSEKAKIMAFYGTIMKRIKKKDKRASVKILLPGKYKE